LKDNFLFAASAIMLTLFSCSTTKRKSSESGYIHPPVNINKLAEEIKTQTGLSVPHTQGEHGIRKPGYQHFCSSHPAK
jgi:hypothetical protein